MADDHMQEAQREVDELTPGSDTIASEYRDAIGRDLAPSDPEFLAQRDEPERLIDVDITADEVFAANDHRIIPVNVDEWKKGAKVYIHTISAADKDHLERVMLKSDEKDPESGNALRKVAAPDEVRAYFIAMCARNSNGDRIFTAADVPKLKLKNAVVMDRIYEAILEAQIITEQDVREMAKN
jgi:hypothetical protein